MSGDMMQALSGSSLLSLSFGTLPAVKAGMNLDANPFASQLALMTGPDTAAGGMLSPLAGAAIADGGEFSLALADGLQAAQAPQASVVLAPAFPVAQVAAIATPVAVGRMAAPSVAAVLSADVAALPEDASPTQMIEAVLNGSAAPAAATRATEIAGLQKSRPQSRAELAAPQATHAPDAVILADPAQALQSRIESQASPSRQSAKADDSAPVVADAAIMAAIIIPATAPVAPEPEFVAPENGTTRKAVSATPAAESATKSAIARQIVSGPPVFGPPVTLQSHARQPAVLDPMTDANELPQPDTRSTLPPQPLAMDSSPAHTTLTAPQVQANAIPAAPASTASARATATPAGGAAPTSRPGSGISAQRAVQSAVQAPQPAQALAAVFDLGDPVAQPADVEALAETPAAIRTETVQPSWVAALNAVTSPAAASGLQALSAPLAANPPSLETLAFDAGFVAGIETQIARVASGGQMVRMQIMPEHLGRIDIEMLAGPDRHQVRLVTEHDAVRDTLVQSQVRLEQDLRQNGQRNTEVTVELRQQSPGAQGGSAQQQRGQSGADSPGNRDTAQRQNGTANADRTTPAPGRSRGNVRYA